MPAGIDRIPTAFSFRTAYAMNPVDLDRVRFRQANPHNLSFQSNRVEGADHHVQEAGMQDQKPNNGSIKDIGQMKVFDNTSNREAYHQTKVILAILATFFIATAIFVWRIEIFIAGIAFVSLLFLWVWYQQDYLKPKQIDIYPWGMILSYRHREPFRMQWTNIRGVYRSRPNGLRYPSLRLYQEGSFMITFEILNAVDSAYLAATGSPIRTWDWRKQWGE